MTSNCPSLFARRDGVETAWSFIAPVLEAWNADRAELPLYEPGSAGPAAADVLLARDGREWRPLAAHRAPGDSEDSA